MSFDKEMQRALEADAEKLRQLTGEDHRVEFAELDELLPCPFCGGEAARCDVDTDDPENCGGSYITCTRCGASSPVHFDRKENLYSSWNDRVKQMDGAVEHADDES